MAAKIYLHQFTVTEGVLVASQYTAFAAIAMRIGLDTLQNWRSHLHCNVSLECVLLAES